MKKINRTVWLILLSISLFAQPILASTESDSLEGVEINAHILDPDQFFGSGIHWTILEIEVENHSGDELEGRLQVYQGSLLTDDRLMAEQWIHLETKATGSYRFTLPESMFYNGVLVRLVTADEQEVLLELKDIYTNKGNPELTIIGEQGNEFHFLKSMEHEYFRYPIARQISPNQLAESFWLYRERVMAIGHLEGELFNQTQLAALEQWVKTGGVLIFSGGEPLLPYADSFAPLLPLDELELVDTPLLSPQDEQRLLEILGIEEVPKAWPPILKGKAKQQVAFFPSEQSPLFAGWRVGNGMVIMATYDVSAEPIASWQGNRELWMFILAKYGAISSIEKKDVHLSEVSRLASFSKNIPSLSAPSLGMISVIWIIYLILIGPVLYVLLKKWDKREWAWLIIPCLVVLTAVSVYTLGLARIANKTSSHMVTAIQIYDPTLAKVDGHASFFVLEGKQFTVQVDESFEAVALAMRNQSESMPGYLVQQTEKRILQYKDVPYMSLAQAKAMGYVERLGYVEHDLWVEGNLLRGTLTNQTSLDLEAIEVQIGKESYELGSLAQQESMEVELDLSRYYYPGYRYANSFELAKPFTDTRMNRYNQETPSYALSLRPTIDLYAISHSPLAGLSIEGEAVDEHYTHFIWQELSLNGGSGEVAIYPYGTLPVYMDPENHLQDDYFYHESILMSGSAATLHFQVMPLSMEVQRIRLPLDEAVFSLLTIKIWNQVTRTWEELATEQALEIGAEELDKYVNPQGELILLFENNKQENVQLPFPYVQVEGEWRS